MTNEIFEKIRLERERQDRKWNTPQPNTLPEWMSILGEEYGEVCTEVNRCHFGRQVREGLETELIQVAAVCVAMLENMSYSVEASDISLDATEPYRNKLIQEKSNVGQQA